MPQVKDCLIVAAGKGTRLQGFGDLKPLITLCGTPLIEHAMRAANRAGVTRFVVVTGYKAPLLHEFLKTVEDEQGWQIDCVENPEYEKSNGISVLAAAPFLTGEFFLAMCDHVVETSLYEALQKSRVPKSSIALGVDLRMSNPDVDLADVTKVAVRNGQITAIGKSLSRYNAFDTGIFRANPILFESLEQSRSKSGDCSISSGMRLLAETGHALGIDVGQSRWLDVDAPQMHDKARQWLQSQSLQPSKSE